MEIEIGQTRKQGDDQRQSNLIDYIGLFFRRKVNVVLPLHRKVDVKSVHSVCTVPRFRNHSRNLRLETKIRLLNSTVSNRST